MIYVSLAVVFLLLLGLKFFFNITWQGTKIFILTSKNVLIKKYREYKAAKKVPLKKQIEIMTGKKKTNFIVQNYSDAKKILEYNKQEEKIRRINILSVCGAAAGILFSILIRNLYIMPPLAVGFALIPMWAVKLSESRSKKQLNADLEVALSGITTSYIRMENIIVAAEENLVNLETPLKEVFAKFVNENKLINSNIVYGIQKLKMGIENPIFDEWCDAVIQCQSDKSLKVTLLPIVNKFSETKNIQQELDTLMMIPFRDFITLAVIVVLSIPLMYVLNKDWFNVLVNTSMGKIILSLTSVAILYGINKAINLSKPIEFRN